MSYIIGILNRKGGVGKTTTAINLGRALSMQGRRVLLIDNDAQANLTEGFGIDPSEHTLYHCYADQHPLPITTIDDCLDIVPSSSDLDTVQNFLLDDINRNYKLDDAIKPVTDQYDFILIDCPPSLGVLTANALTAATHYLVTAQAGSAFSTTGVNEVTTMIEQKVKKRINPQIACLGILVTFYSTQTNISAAVVADLLEAYGPLVFDTRIRFLTKLMEAPYLRKDIFAHAPQSTAADDYQSLSAEVQQRVQHG